MLRVPKLDLPAVLAQQNPQIDLRLEAYEVSTRNFLKAVSNYTQRAVTEITNRKNTFNSEKKKVAEKTQQVETETSQCKLKEIELIAGASVFLTRCEGYVPTCAIYVECWTRSRRRRRRARQAWLRSGGSWPPSRRSAHLSMLRSSCTGET